MQLHDPRWIAVTFVFLMGSCLCNPVSSQTRTAPDPLHAWEAKTPEDLTLWAQAHIDDASRAEQALLSVHGVRTINNTLEPYDVEEDALGIAFDQTSLLCAVATEKALRATSCELQQKVSAARASRNLNTAIYGAMAALSQSHEVKRADSAAKYYLQRILLGFRLAGVNRPAPERAQIAALRKTIERLSIAFGRNIRDDVTKVSASPTELEGLPTDFVGRHERSADGSVLLTTNVTDFTPVMKFSESSALRKRMLKAYGNVAYPVNLKVFHDLLAARWQLKNLLGFATYADLATADQMMGSAAAARAFLSKMDAITSKSSQRELNLLTTFVAKSDADNSALNDASVDYWREKYHRSLFNFDSQAVRRYLPYAEVEAGVLAVSAKLFQIKFVPIRDAQTWNQNVTTFDVYDATDGASTSKLGRIYLDMHPRAGKDRWFSTRSIVTGIKDARFPEAAIVGNFSETTPNDPGLMEFADVVNFFHEFGHLLNHIMSGNARWTGQQPFDGPLDFGEAPAQMLGEVSRQPEILQSFAKDYQSGEPIPSALIEQMNRSDAFGRATVARRQLFLAQFSLQTHMSPPNDIDLDHLFKNLQSRYTGIAANEDTHFFASFAHITEYSSNNYSYLLDKMIAVNFLDKIRTVNSVSEKEAMEFRHKVLSVGASKPSSQIVSDFLNHRPSYQVLGRWFNESAMQ